MPHIPASSALSHLRVIDLTQVRAGPTCCRQLADWGADVVQVQMPEHMRGDDTLGGQEGSDYQYTHRNKRSITLNLKAPAGLAVFKRLVATADVVVLIYRPEEDAEDKMKKLELAGIADITIAKNRNGPRGKFQLTWVGSYSSFYNPEQGEL